MYALLPLLLSGCPKEADKDSGQPYDTLTDPNVSELVAGACEVTSTLDVRFVVDVAATAVIEFGPTTSYGWETVPTASRTTHRIQVPAFPNREEWHWRIVLNETLVGSDQTFTGGAPPTALSPFVPGTMLAGEFTSGFRTVPGLSVPNYLVVVNDDGDMVWWQEFQEPEVITQARMLPSGGGIEYLLQDQTRETDIGTIVRRDWCGDQLEGVPAPWGHHDFTRVGDDRYAFISADIREEGRQTIVGDTLMEIGLDGSDLTSIWSTWDNLEVDVEADCEAVFYPQGCDWTHGNNIAYSEEDDTYFQSLHNLNAIVRISRGGGVADAGVTEWVAGGDQSTLRFTGESGWARQHGFKPVGDDEYVVFDNGTGGAEKSEVRRVRVDEEAGTVEDVWTWDYDERHRSYLLGDVHLMDNGNYYVGWGSEGELTEVTPGGDLVWQLNAALPAAVGFSNLYPNIGGEFE